MAEVFSFGTDPISCHAWNNNNTQLAVSHNNAEVKIYTRKDGSMREKWQEIHTLKEHAQNVSGIDWAPKTNRIVTTAADRNSYVWNLVNGEWKPTLVILRIDRAATCVAWSPKENKFAVGSGSKILSVCYFDEEHDWWVSKHIKKGIRSTVTCLSWHPNNYLVACGAADFKARIFSAFVKDIEEKPSPNSWGKKMPMGNLMGDFSNGGGDSLGGWIHSISFSPSGDRLAWVGHDSSVCAVDASNPSNVLCVRTPHLPFTSCLWASENSLITAGHSYCPMLYVHQNNGKIEFKTALDKPKEDNKGSKFSAMNIFQNRDRRAIVDSIETDDEGNPIFTPAKSVLTHKNTITSLKPYTKDHHSGQLTAFSTSGLDGQIVVWSIKTLESSIAGLRIM